MLLSSDGVTPLCAQVAFFSPAGTLGPATPKSR